MKPSQLSVRGLIALLLLAVVGGVTVGLLPFSAIRSRLDRLSGDGSADAYTESIHSRFQLAGWAGAIVAGGFAGWLLRNRQKLEKWAATQLDVLRADCRKLTNAAARSMLGAGFFLGLLTVIAIGVRTLHHNQPVSFDEAYTFNAYAKWPIPLIVTRYNEPNNHVFHSVLVHLAYRVFGDSRLAIRIPAYVCGVLTPLLTFLLARRSFGTRTALCAALATAVMPQIVFYSVNARGYTISIVLFLVALLASHLAIRRDNLAAWLVIVLANALAIWTLPTMVYAAIGFFGWMLIKRRQLHRSVTPVVIAGAASVLLAVVLYLPIALTLGTERMSSVGGSYSKPFLQFVQDLPAAFQRVVLWFGWTIPVWCQWLILGGLVFAMLRPATRRKFAPVLGACLLILAPLTLQRIEPPERIWIFAAPLVFIFSSAGWDSASRLLPQGWRAVAPVAVAVVITMGTSVAILSFGPVLWSPETAHFPQAERVARDLVRLAGDKEPIITVTPASSTIIFNAPRAGLPEIHFMPPGRGYTNDDTAIVVTSIGFKQVPQDVLEELKLLDFYDVKSAKVIMEYETGTLWRVEKIRGD